MADVVMAQPAMEAETLEALEGSIEKWRKIAYENGPDRGSANCPLCDLFNTRHGCSGCPVQGRTAAHYCAHTPYDDWTDYFCQNEHHLDKRVFDDESKRLAIEEYAFLKSLLPEASDG